MRPTLGTVLFLLWLVCWKGPVSAHDLWIEPFDFTPKAGEELPVRLWVGQLSLAEALPRIPELIDRFILVSSEGSVPIPGIDLSDPAGYVRIATPGAQVIGYQSLPYRIDVPSATFERYLIEEGLDQVQMFRQHEGSTGAPGRERFSRCAKSYVVAGTRTAAANLPPLDFILEILPDWKELPMKPGDHVSVRVRFHGEPLPGILIKASSQNRPDRMQAKRADREGRADFTLDEPGVWLIKSVHMIDAGGDADWESFWASMTFEVAD